MSKERGLLDRHYVHADVSSPLTRSAVHKDIRQYDLTLPTGKVQNVIPVRILERMDEKKPHLVAPDLDVLVIKKLLVIWVVKTQIQKICLR